MHLRSNFDSPRCNIALQAFNVCIDKLGSGRGRDLGNRLFTAFTERGLTGLMREALKPEFQEVRLLIQCEIATSGVDYHTLLMRATFPAGQHQRPGTATLRLVA